MRNRFFYDNDRDVPRRYVTRAADKKTVSKLFREADYFTGAIRSRLMDEILPMMLDPATINDWDESSWLSEMGHLIAETIKRDKHVRNECLELLVQGHPLITGR